MIVECPNCEAKVDGEVMSQLETGFDDDDPEPFLLTFLKCPVCSGGILVGQYPNPDPTLSEIVWHTLIRLWPEPEKFIDINIPPIVRLSIEEAEKCYQAKAYDACSVMCGRTLEGICSHFETESTMLYDGLRELKNRSIIDSKLYEWSEELRKHRNLCAHATMSKISKQEAKDLLDFANSICEYTFILTKKYDDFLARKEKR